MPRRPGRQRRQRHPAGDRALRQLGQPAQRALDPPGRRHRVRPTRPLHRHFGHRRRGRYLRERTVQHWQPQSDGTVRSNGKCLVEGGAAAGSTLSIGSCSGAAATKWKLVSAGPIATELVNMASGLCAGIPATGTRLALAACANAATTTWHVE